VSAGRLLLAAACGALALLPGPPAAASPPDAGAVGPAGPAGNPRVFPASYTDGDGWRDLRAVRLTVRSAADPATAIAARYLPGANRLALWDGTRWRGSCRPGDPAAVVVPEGRLYCRHTRVRGRGRRLRVRWFLGLRAPLAGADLELLTSAVDRTGGRSGWTAAGSWRVPDPLPPGLQVLPADNPWNTDVSAYPVHPDSAAFIASMGADRTLHADFGTAWRGSPIGIPYVLVGAAQAPVPVSFRYADESDPGPYPIPPAAPVEGGPLARGDRHVLVVDVDCLLLYEIFNARRDGPGWAAGSGAVFDLTSNALRPAGWTSADAAGLPILPGLVRREEVAAGEIRHALRFTASRTQRGYIAPATHFASSSTDPALPPMGLRVRLRADFDTSGFPPAVRTILRALQTYGMLVADNGSDWFLSGAPSEDWDDDELRLLGAVRGADFEAVETGPILH